MRKKRMYRVDRKPYRDKTGKYYVTMQQKYSGRSVHNVYKTKASAKRAIQKILKSEYYKKRGYSNPRIKIVR